MKMTEKLRILLAEDHQTVREGIKLLVNAQPDMEVIGEADDGERAIKMALDLRHDLLLMDISMPNMNGLRATKRLRALSSDIKILTLTRHTDDGYLQQLIGAGANGYVLKQSAPSDLVNAIRSVCSGNSYLDPALTRKVMGGYAGRAGGLRGESKGDLTDRENEVLRLIAFGYSNKEIAAQLDLSVKTIEAHKSNAMRRLGIASRTDIVRYAILQNWLQDN
jgi:DNA-binding NarL/FixJ family response regulator